MLKHYLIEIYLYHYWYNFAGHDFCIQLLKLNHKVPVESHNVIISPHCLSVAYPKTTNTNIYFCKISQLISHQNINVHFNVFIELCYVNGDSQANNTHFHEGVAKIKNTFHSNFFC